MCMAFTCVYALFSYPTLTFNQSFSCLYGNDHVVFLDNEGKLVQISLDSNTGGGFISQNAYLHAYFSASVKLQAGYTAGAVATFYTSNVNIYASNSHDKLDFMFLDNIEGKRIKRGREERYNLWFDPTQDFHAYRILWTSNWIVFYVDELGGDFLSKPMSLYATIWDGSSWLGKPINYTYAPFVTKCSNFILHGCSVDPTRKPPKCEGGFDLDLSFKGMKNFRLKQMTYSYCNDRKRYSTSLPESEMDPEEARKLSNGLSS
ncbi:hypothetical protein P3X46_014911 [Hevea brasiliensis]|uniref:Xyloglucan endotransglucosylase/hydrolase n=1 Tax=Hevea brasiliensis TaxID=3981 RepID=A0ABQ9LVI7_HEVBR|nr:hypothetical protein P3X46_014911 [Hevea brasiliensis]